VARYPVIPRMIDGFGNALIDGHVFVYEEGTTTEVEVFGDEVGGVALAYPLLTAADGAVEIWTEFVGEVDVLYADSGVTKDVRGRRRPFPDKIETRRVGPARDVVVIDNTGAAYEIDSAAGTLFDLTLDASCTFTLADAPQAVSVVAQLTQVGGFTVGWPGSVLWPNGVDPTMSPDPGAIDIYILLSLGPGSWAGMVAGANLT
jgi:hypothetical protein